MFWGRWKASDGPLWAPWAIEVELLSPPPAWHLIMKFGCSDKCIFRVPRLIDRSDWRLKWMLTGCRHWSLSWISALHPLSYKHANSHMFAPSAFETRAWQLRNRFLEQRPWKMANCVAVYKWFVLSGFVPGQILGASLQALRGWRHQAGIRQRNTWSFLSWCSWPSHVVFISTMQHYLKGSKYPQSLPRLMYWLDRCSLSL